MRNWLGELKEAGHSITEIAKETGFSRGKVSRMIKTGITSKADWNKTYNTARRMAWRDLSSKSDLTTKELKRVVSHAYNPNQTTGNRIRRVEKIVFEKTYQLRIVGQFRDEKTRMVRVAEGWSKTHHKINKADIKQSISDINRGEYFYAKTEGDKDIDLDDMVFEAISHAQSKLGGSNWVLERVLDSEIVEYRTKE